MDDQQVEHVIPRSAPETVPVNELDVTNMIACCTGGAARNLFGPDARGDAERYLPPARRNISGSFGFRVDETDRGTPLGEAAVTVQAHAVICPARAGGGDGLHREA